MEEGGREGESYLEVLWQLFDLNAMLSLEVPVGATRVFPLTGQLRLVLFNGLFVS